MNTRTSPIPADFAVQPITPDDPTAIAAATCGTCGLTWDDGIPTSWTPAPSGRCPFEYFHTAIRDLQLLEAERLELLRTFDRLGTE